MEARKFPPVLGLSREEKKEIDMGSVGDELLLHLRPDVDQGEERVYLDGDQCGEERFDEHVEFVLSMIEDLIGRSKRTVRLGDTRTDNKTQLIAM